MSRRTLSTWQKATALVPLALLSGAWTTSLTVPSAAETAAGAAAKAGRLPDGTTVPEEAIEAPASVSAPGQIAPGVPDGTADDVIAGSSTNGIPAAALSAYQRAAQVIDAADKGCRIGWPLIAAIGRVESNHGRYGGNVLDDNGVSRPGIYGIPLDGSNGTARIADTDAGQYDDDTSVDRAVGPMQFIPSTWSVVGVDGDGDGKRNPQDIDDAALATAVYLCSGDEDLSTAAGQRSAVYRYNHSNEYVALVLSIMRAYADGDFAAVPTSAAGAATFTPDYGAGLGAAQGRGPGHRGTAGKARGGKGGSGSHTRSGGPGSTGGSGSGSGSTGTLPGGGTGGSSGPSAPTATAPAPVRKTVKKVTDGVKKTTKKVTDTATGTVQDPVGSTTKTLTRAEATEKCLASGISKLDVLALNKCVDGLLG